MPLAGTDLDDVTLGARRSAAGVAGARTTDPVSRARRVVLISAAVTLALFVVPYGDLIARPLLYLSTLVHELGHGLAAMMAGGRFVRLEMWSDGSGVAQTLTVVGSKWQPALTLAGGLIGPAVAAALGFAVARRASWSRWGLGAIGLLLVWAMIFKVRTGFGLVVTGAVAGGALLVAWRARAEWAQMVLVFLSVQLALSVFSRGDYLFMEKAQTGAGVGPSDTAALGQVLGGPYWLWGGVCAALSLVALAAGAWLMLRGVARQRARAA
ncbi:MAG TPA: M50 family metallopeptidase [Kofleriaceae bacterium]|nr:M50 family metallopeptidase [Kofleriaceae bacterium]